jgi:predicted MFS family arabinose efflux permease
VITRELSAEFALSAASLGNLSAFYFYSYVAVQIPTGLLADRWGPRKVLTAGAALTALGTLLFAYAPGVAWANAGRLAIGAAAGVAFVSMLKLSSHWMPATRYALASGLALFTGVMGATLAGVPLRAAVDAFGWREVMSASGIATALLAAAIWLLVRDDPHDRGYASYYRGAHEEKPLSIAAHIREALSYRNTWLLFAMAGGLSAIGLTFAGLWGVPFLVNVYGFTPAQAAATASAMLVAWSVGGIAYAPISERLRRRKPVFLFGLAASVVLWSVVVFVPGLPGWLLVALLVGVGIFSGVIIIVFAFAKESVPLHVAGTASGVANMGVMLGGMVMQPLVGIILDRNWTGTLVDGVRVYDAAAYRWGFAAMLAWSAVSFVLLLLTRETYCRSSR